MKASILGYGVYLPRYAISVSEIAAVWSKSAVDIVKSLGVSQKTVAACDEDCVTMAYEAAYRAVKMARVLPEQIESCLVGSESHPYAVNPTSTIVGEFLGAAGEYLAADLQFACKAATAGMIAIKGLVESSSIKMGLVIGSDRAQSKPHDVLEYTSACAAVAFIIGKDDGIARIEKSVSFSSDTPDFWRRDGVKYPTHGGRFTGEPAYFTHVVKSAQLLFNATDSKASDYTYAVFHMPNGKFPREAAKRLGFTADQLKPSLIVDSIGNPYSASSLLGLASVLDVAKKGDRIFMASYGSGAGSDAFSLTVTAPRIEEKKEWSVSSMISNLMEVSYTRYLRMGGRI